MTENSSEAEDEKDDATEKDRKKSMTEREKDEEEDEDKDEEDKESEEEGELVTEEEEDEEEEEEEDEEELETEEDEEEDERSESKPELAKCSGVGSSSSVEKADSALSTQEDTPKLLKPQRVEPVHVTPPPPAADCNATGNPTVVDDVLERVLSNDPELTEVNLNNIDDISKVKLLRT